MNVLIIGGTRFLGAAIARELRVRGHRVALLHRGRTKGDTPEDAEHILCDARNWAQVEPQLRRGWDAVIDTILSARDLSWCLPLLRETAGQLIHCGSTGVYAPMRALPAREDDPTPCPEELGGFGEKLAQDEALLAFHRDTGFRACSLRVSNIFGPGDVPLDGWGARNPAWFRRVAQHQEVWIPNDGRALLQPVHIADLARGFCDAMACEKAAGQIYNLSSDRAVTLNEYVDVVKDLLNSSSPLRHVPMDAIIATGKTDESGVRFLCEHMSIDSGKALRDFGYVPRIGVREGLQESLAWMRDTGLLQ